MRIRSVLLSSIAVLTFSVGSTLQVAQADSAKASTARAKLDPEMKARVECSAMAGKAIPAEKIALPTGGATIGSAENKPGSGQEGTPDYVPAYCDIKGSIAPVDSSAPPINFEVNIPANWNGKPFKSVVTVWTASFPFSPLFLAEQPVRRWGLPTLRMSRTRLQKAMPPTAATQDTAAPAPREPVGPHKEGLRQ